MAKVLSDIDFKLLKEQKLTLLEIIEERKDSQYLKDKKQVEHVEGVVNLIDEIQDFAVAELGVTEEEVFGDLN